jgi:glutaredoxin-like YruB-family protein
MKDHTVTVYSTATCHYCVLAKDYLDKKGVHYDAIDVGVDRAKAMEMITKSGQMGVPVVEIDGQCIVGFQPNEFDRLLA